MRSLLNEVIHGACIGEFNCSYPMIGIRCRGRTRWALLDTHTHGILRTATFLIHWVAVIIGGFTMGIFSHFFSIMKWSKNYVNMRTIEDCNSSTKSSVIEISNNDLNSPFRLAQTLKISSSPI